MDIARDYGVRGYIETPMNTEESELTKEYTGKLAAERAKCIFEFYLDPEFPEIVIPNFHGKNARQILRELDNHFTSDIHEIVSLYWELEQLIISC
ncbi:hypothetical protein BROUX41_000490 [Berkeleyomyces rouxiae]|uniref:uncharacterized protein n=1 Tax=Berkeleyomyces rouxiae TaxID=2035830 RepID=UPI003B7861C9